MKNQKPSPQQPGNAEPAPEAAIEIIATGITSEVATGITDQAATEARIEIAAHNAGADTPAPGIHILGRRMALAGLGIFSFGVDQLLSLFARATERGQMLEKDMQHKLADASEHSTETVSSTLASILNHLPGVRVAYQPPLVQPAQQDAAPAATPDGQG